jgi:hypothetical protein
MSGGRRMLRQKESGRLMLKPQERWRDTGECTVTDIFDQLDDLSIEITCDASFCGRPIGDGEEYVVLFDAGQIFHAKCAHQMESNEWAKYVQNATEYTDSANRRIAMRDA